MIFDGQSASDTLAKRLCFEPRCFTRRLAICRFLTRQDSDEVQRHCNLAFSRMTTLRDLAADELPVLKRSRPVVFFTQRQTCSLVFCSTRLSS